MIFVILADSHGYAHGSGGMAIWPVVLILGLATLIVLLVVLALLRRNPKQPDEGQNTGGGPPLTPPTAASSMSQAAGQPPPSGGDPVQQAARMGDYLYCEDSILDVLRQKGWPMAQKDICADTGLTEQEVTGALASLEQRGMVKRTWDRGQSTYMVEAT